MILAKVRAFNRLSLDKATVRWHGFTREWAVLICPTLNPTVRFNTEGIIN